MSASWEHFVWVFLTRRPGERAALEAAIQAQPERALAHGWLALSRVLFGWPGVDAAVALERARRGTAGTEAERSLLAVIAKTVESGLWPSQESWLRHNHDHPGDPLGLTIANHVIEMGTGPRTDQVGRHTACLRMLGEHPAVLGSLAMVHQDAGRLEEAASLAQRALDLDPAGPTGAHPTAHVFFESEDHAAGRAWLDEWLPGADSDGPLLGHLTWHGALHDLALGDRESALMRYQACAVESNPWRLADGPSLLWRCQLRGHVAPGADPARIGWGSLVRPLLDDVPSTFVGLQVALALATTRDAEGLRAYADRARGFSAPGAAELLPRVALALACQIEGEAARAADHLLAMESAFWRYGGSHAQREVLDDTLIRVLIEADRPDEASKRLEARLDRLPR
ncbi:MAG: hypothetical protein V9G04_09705 [Nocardioides sp.]